MDTSKSECVWFITHLMIYNTVVLPSTYTTRAAIVENDLHHHSSESKNEQSDCSDIT